ncbi:MAG: DUF1838 family protein [Rhodospirillaceae bacterium]|nr:DUF1838 family protein [Rhodospirillaceae bacterium]
MTNDSQFTLNIGRRQALNFSVSALATASIAPLANTAVASGYFESSDPVSVLRTLHRMRGSEDGRIAMGWLKGQRYGVVDGEITPLMGMVTGTFARHKVRDDGAVEISSFELAFYTDFQTGDLLDTLTIPYTGKTVEVPRLLLGPNKRTIRPVFHELMEMGGEVGRTESETAMRPVGSTRLERWLGPVTVKDSNVWITEASSAKLVPANPEADKVIYSESVTYKADYEDVVNSDLPTITSTMSYTGITSWRPWMQMGEHSGHTTSHALGSKSFDVGGLPDDYRAMAEKYYPDAIKDPAAILDKIG